MAFKDKTYKPKAILKYLDPSPLNWESLIGLEASQELVPVGGWEGRLELDLFGNGAVDDLIGQLAQEKPPLSPDEVIHRLHRLNSMVAFRKFQTQFHREVQHLYCIQCREREKSNY